MNLLSKLKSANSNLTINFDGNCATWEDLSSHKFVGLEAMKNASVIHFQYKGTGHALFGICLSDGTEVHKFKVRCHQEHGKGAIELRADEVILSMDEKTSKHSLSSNIMDEVKPFFDIRFGSLHFSVRGVQFQIPQYGQVDSNVLSLDKSYSPNSFCYLENPLTTTEVVELTISSADSARYWSVDIYLTNDKPTSHRMPESYLFRNIKQYSGTIRLSKDERICLQYKGKSRYANSKKIHLSRDVFVCLCLFRCKVTTTVYKSVNSTLPYVSPQPQACVSQISLEEMVLDSNAQKHSRPTDEFDQALNPKSPRLDSQQMDDQQTRVKQFLSDDDDDDNDIGQRKLDNFLNMLDLTNTMIKECKFPKEYVSMFKPMQVSFQNEIDILENNVFVPPCQIELAKQNLKDTFQRLSLQ